MLPIVSTTAMRNADHACIKSGIPAITLMHRAGEGLFSAWDFAALHQSGKSVAILCGIGNNGGDGYVLALLLWDKGYDCTLVLAEEKWSADGKYYYDKCMAAGIPCVVWQDGRNLPGDGLTGYGPHMYGLHTCGLHMYGLLVDCLFGTGFRGTVRQPYADIIRAANESGVPILSADIPSGLSGDNGLPAVDETGKTACIRAAVTLSIGSRKTGQYLGQGKDWCGTVVNRDIGIPVADVAAWIPEMGDFGDIFPRRAQCSHKGTYGYVAVMGGCSRYSGAVKLANLAASSLRCGCGVVKLLCGQSLTQAVTPYLLESTLVPLPDNDGELCFCPDALTDALKGTAALAVGMGWGNGGDNEQILTWILENYEKNLIIDADGLNCLGRMEAGRRTALLQAYRTRTKRPVILTPHPMEFQRLSGVTIADCATDPIGCAMTYARETGVVLLLKGASTIVTDGEICYVVPRGCAGMATAGSGDVLSGVLAGLCGYHVASAKVVACGAYTAGLAGELAEADVGEVGMIASDTVRYLAKAVREIQKVSGK